MIVVEIFDMPDFPDHRATEKQWDFGVIDIEMRQYCSVLFFEANVGVNKFFRRLLYEPVKGTVSKRNR